MLVLPARRISLYLVAFQLFPFRCDVKLYSFSGSFQGGISDQEDDEDYVWEGGSHIHNLQHIGNRNIMRGMSGMMPVTYTAYTMRKTEEW